MTRKQRHPLVGLAIEILGWILVVLGIAALVLPGPGLLGLFAGIALLATRYDWAERRVEPLKKLALKAAADSVSNWLNLFVSVLGVLIIGTVGTLWVVQPPAPGWWPLPESLWLAGGWGVGVSLIVSAIIAAGLIVISFIKFRRR